MGIMVYSLLWVMQGLYTINRSALPGGESQDASSRTSNRSLPKLTLTEAPNQGVVRVSRQHEPTTQHAHHMPRTENTAIRSEYNSAPYYAMTTVYFNCQAKVRAREHAPVTSG